MSNEGEVCENCKPVLVQQQERIAGLQYTVNAQAAKIGRFQREDTTKLREHADWDRAARLFRFWQRQTGRTGSRFTVARFKQCLPYLAEYEDEILMRAICGLAYDPWTTRNRNGVEEIHNWWHTLFNKDKSDNIERYANKAPLDFKETLEEHAEEVEARS